MRIVLPNHNSINVYLPLAKEIGLEDSLALLALENEIAIRGMEKDGQRMVARTTKQLQELLPWLKGGQAKKVFESLCKRDFVYMIDATLMINDSTRWLGLNWKKLQTLDSIVVLGDGDIEDLQIPREDKIKQQAIKKNGIPQLHKDLMPVVIKMSNLTSPLVPRDASEAWEFIKKITARYPSEDFDRLQKRILGMRVWQEARKAGGDKFQAPRPLTAWSNWERYGDYCREQHRGLLPPIPKEWIEETGRK